MMTLLLGVLTILMVLLTSSCGTPEEPADPFGQFPTFTSPSPFENTGEARVRYIMTDIQLSGLYDYYLSFPEDPEVLEAIRRWDQGIRVVNIDQFERKMAGDNWQIVYYGTETIINGMDVILSEAVGEATITIGIAYPSEGDLPIPGDIYLYATNLDNGTTFSASWTGDHGGSVVVSAPGRYRINAMVQVYDQSLPFLYSVDCSSEMEVYVNPGDVTGPLTLILCP
jgi:hypothetical protein